MSANINSHRTEYISTGENHIARNIYQQKKILCTTMYLITLITVCLKTCKISTEEDIVYYNVLDSFDNSLSEDLYNIN